MSNGRMSRDEKEKLEAMNQVASEMAGCAILANPVSLRDQLVSQKIRLSRDLRRVENSIKEIEATGAEDVLARAKEVLGEVGPF